MTCFLTLVHTGERSPIQTRERGHESTSREGDDKDGQELTGQRRKVQRQDVGGTGGEEGLSILYNNHQLILLYLKIISISL